MERGSCSSGPADDHRVQEVTSLRYIYVYRDSHNERHEATLSASSRDDVFRQLRAVGIRPSSVTLAPGLANRILSLGKRGLIIVGLMVLVGVLSVVAFRPASRPVGPEGALDTTLNAQTRRQPIGDAAVIDAGIRSGWAEVFDQEGDRFLASFAIPGARAGQRNTTEAEILKALETHVAWKDDDAIEARQIKSMVEGMKVELGKYLSAGGTVGEYGQELVRRQEAEIAVRQRAVAEIQAKVDEGRSPESLQETLNTLNRSLRRMGIKTLTMPERSIAN